MKKLILAAAIAATVPMASAKVLINIDGGVGYNINSLGEGSHLMNETFNLTSKDVTSDSYGLNMEANNGLYGWASISLPLLPDVKLKYESLVLEGTNNFTLNQEVYGQQYTMDGDIASTLDLSHLDMALTIGLPLPVVDIDFGLNVRSMLGGFSATGDVSGERETVEAPFQIGSTPLIVPMGYVSAAGTIPGAGVKVSGELSTLPLGDTKISDWNIKGTWYAPLPTNMLVKVGLEGGYRNFSMVIGDSTLGADTSDFASDVGVSGFFLGATAHF
ncbi:TIGR04219 family outer membrane beta-barrel protein [Reinekea marina]|uniref:TIGR04219 family outer membrane beta-barrel protein n=1 Tax=Reinekea marina TaxID=1310421 RepID=A0ABV7WQZ0_9GAMM|nr:TIGR04219 family outer membrane beta-barrel protein [Reinekea marina]MBU2863060.1 TIGR04219 family outer membrane beta-barrel protein [Reinekea forsetii]MDN3650255.1 TIGR04219 family outer membrane beta-barrel protein [Reinekea marina]